MVTPGSLGTSAFEIILQVRRPWKTDLTAQLGALGEGHCEAPVRDEWACSLIRISWKGVSESFSAMKEH